ncbi:MAG: glycosyltransferase family 2 protein [Prevotella sp.]|nr:glycosyltransferase family 2 protein [Prevotella sp.]
MSETNKISVVINTRNAEQHLQEVIDAVKDFDEVLICDMESTDNTVVIAQKNGCRIVTFPKADHKSAEPARTFAIQSATSPWVLVVDADEIVTPELRDYLYRRIEQPDCPAGLYIPRLNKFMGKTMTCAYPDYQLRFFIREGTEWPPYVHTFPKVNGRLDYLPKSQRELALIHLANDSIHSIMEKDNRYSDNDVDKKAHKNYGAGALLWRPFWRFFKCYVMEGGWRDGIQGLIYAGLKGVYQFELVAKMIERRHSQEQS